MTRDSGVGFWPSAEDHAAIGGPVRPIATDGGADGEEFPGTVDNLSPALRRRVEALLRPEESIEAFLARAWARNAEIPAVETVADAAVVECKERELTADEEGGLEP